MSLASAMRRGAGVPIGVRLWRESLGWRVPTDAFARGIELAVVSLHGPGVHPQTRPTSVSVQENDMGLDRGGVDSVFNVQLLYVLSYSLNTSH